MRNIGEVEMKLIGKRFNLNFRVNYIIVFLFLFSGCASVPVVYFSRIEEARIDTKGIKRIAVLIFSRAYGASEKEIFGENAGNLKEVQVEKDAEGFLMTRLVELGHFQVVERAQIDKVLSEQALGLTGAINESTAAKVGALLGADGVIVGDIVAFSEETKGMENVERKVGTGEYEEVEEKKFILWGPKVKRKREIMKTVTVQEEYIAKRGIVSLSLRLVNANTGVVMGAWTDRKTYNRKGVGASEISRLPSDLRLSSELASEMIEHFVYAISPHPVSEERYLSYGEKDDELVRRGVIYAKQDLWNEAINEWKKAIELNPVYAGAHNNLGVAYERVFKFNYAEDEYKKALSLEPKNSYTMENLKRMRKWYSSKSKEGKI